MVKADLCNQLKNFFISLLENHLKCEIEGTQVQNASLVQYFPCQLSVVAMVGPPLCVTVIYATGKNRTEYIKYHDTLFEGGYIHHLVNFIMKLIPVKYKHTKLFQKISRISSNPPNNPIMDKVC